RARATDVPPLAPSERWGYADLLEGGGRGAIRSAARFDDPSRSRAGRADQLAGHGAASANLDRVGSRLQEVLERARERSDRTRGEKGLLAAAGSAVADQLRVMADAGFERDQIHG